MTEIYLDAAELDDADQILVHPEMLRRSPRRRWHVGNVLAILLAAAGAAIAIASALGVDTGRDSAASSLIELLPLLYWVGIASAVAVTAGVVWAASAGDGRAVLTLLVPLWIILLHVAPALASPNPVANRTAQVVERSTTIPVDGLAGELSADAPGLVGLVSVVVGGLSDSALEWTVRSWSVVLVAVMALLVCALTNRSYPRTRKAGPLAALVYVAISWFGTGDLATQSITLMMLMASLVLVETGPLQAEPGVMSRIPLLARQAASIGDRPDSYSIAVFVALLLVSFGATASDPFVPAAVCSSFFILAAYGRRVALRLWLLALLGFTAWTLLAGRPWWSNRFGEMPDELNTLATSLSGGTADGLIHSQVTAWAGTLTFSFVLLCGALMTVERFGGLRPTVPIVPLALAGVVASMVTYSAESLGSQILALVAPFAAVLAGRVLSSGRRTAATVAIPVVMAMAVPVFLIIRFDGATDEQAAVWVPTAGSETIDGTEAS